MAAARSWFAGKSVGVILLILGALCVLAAGAVSIAAAWVLLPLVIRAEPVNLFGAVDRGYYGPAASVSGPGSPPGSRSPRAAACTGSTGHGDRYLARSWAKRPSPPARPTRSWANATDASPADVP